MNTQDNEIQPKASNVVKRIEARYEPLDHELIGQDLQWSKYHGEEVG